MPHGGILNFSELSLLPQPPWSSGGMSSFGSRSFFMSPVQLSLSAIYFIFFVLSLSLSLLKKKTCCRFYLKKIALQKNEIRQPTILQINASPSKKLMAKSLRGWIAITKIFTKIFHKKILLLITQN